jgi:CubicO group peptidase (beta-lactamase class C family)
MTIWLVLNIMNTKQGWLIDSDITAKDDNAFMAFIKKSLDETSKGNAVVHLITKGKNFASYSLSKGKSVDSNSVFGVSSVSKWVAATAVMTLVEKGKIDLDKPVSTYLTRWKLPESSFNNDDVTVRRLLSHTAGITDGLGHNGFESREQIQPLTEHLTEAKDADEGVDGKVLVGIAPGSSFKYSGGSYNLLQLLVEEVSGKAFEEYMKSAIFTPLKMTNTSYRHDEISNLAEYFDENGKVRNYPFYTSLAATGLYTSANDLHKFISIYFPGAKNTILSQASLLEMRKPVASSLGIDIWGLGTMLFADNNAGDFIIGHGGQSPSLNATVRVNPTNGNAIILLATGNRSLAADTATQWTLWETGNPDIYMIKNLVPAMIKNFLIGCLFIFLVSLVIAWRKRIKSE